MSYHRIRRLFFVIVSVVLLLVVAAFGETYLKYRIRRTLTDQFPSLTIKKLDINVSHPAVRLKNLQLKPTDRTKISIETLNLKPVLSSLVMDRPILENVTLGSITMTISQPEPPTKSPTVTKSTSVTETAPIIPLIIKKIELNQFHIHYKMTDDRTLKLGTYDTRIDKISQTELIRGIDFQLTGRKGSSSEGVNLDFTAGFYEAPFISGTLKIASMSPQPLNVLLNRTKVTNGTVGGKIPFTFHENQLFFNRITARADNLNLKTLASPSTSPSDTSTIVKKNRSGTVPIPITMDGVLLSLTNSTLEWNARTGTHSITVKRGALLSASLHSMNSKFLADGYLKFAHPEGRIRCQGTVEAVSSPLSINPLNCWIKFARLSEVDPLLGPGFPITVQKGSVEGVTKGKISPKSFNLNVNLNFSSLSVKTNSPNIMLLGIPVNVYLSYLKDNSDNLSIQGHLRGALADPQFKINQLRNRLLTNLGLDAALIASGGIPILMGDYVINKAFEFSPIGTLKSTVGRLLGINSSSTAVEPPQITVPDSPRK